MDQHAPPGGSDNPHYAGPERRRAPRRQQRGQATLIPASGDTSVEEQVELFDRSEGGVGFISPRRYTPGAVYRVSLKDESTFLNARLRIVSCRRQADGAYLVGSELY